ncbi:putative polyamine oxidase 5, partial [Cardiosporidium cionae]
ISSRPSTPPSLEISSRPSTPPSSSLSLPLLPSISPPKFSTSFHLPKESVENRKEDFMKRWYCLYKSMTRDQRREVLMESLLDEKKKKVSLSMEQISAAMTQRFQTPHLTLFWKIPFKTLGIRVHVGTEKQGNRIQKTVKMDKGGVNSAYEKALHVRSNLLNQIGISEHPTPIPLLQNPDSLSSFLLKERMPSRRKPHGGNPTKIKEPFLKSQTKLSFRRRKSSLTGEIFSGEKKRRRKRRTARKALKKFSSSLPFEKSMAASHFPLFEGLSFWERQAASPLLLPSSSVDFSESSLPPPVDVLIVGGGTAGLAAASYLQRCGISFRLLESRSRVGGRIFTTSLPSRTLSDGCVLP